MSRAILNAIRLYIKRRSGFCDPPAGYRLFRNGLGQWRFVWKDRVGWEKWSRAGAVRAAWGHYYGVEKKKAYAQWEQQ